MNLARHERGLEEKGRLRCTRLRSMPRHASWQVTRGAHGSRRRGGLVGDAPERRYWSDVEARAHMSCVHYGLHLDETLHLHQPMKGCQID